MFSPANRPAGAARRSSRQMRQRQLRSPKLVMLQPKNLLTEIRNEKMSKFVFPLLLLLFCVGIGFLVLSGRIPADSQPEMIAGIAFLLLMAIGYLIISHRDEKKR